MTRSKIIFFQQSALSGGAFESSNVNGTVENRDCEKAAEGRNIVAVTSVTNVGNKSLDGSEYKTSGKQTEQPSSSERDTQKDISQIELMNSYSQEYEIQLNASSSKTMVEQLSNLEKCATHSSQMSLSETPLRGISSQEQDKMCDFGMPVGLSEAKRRKVSDDDNDDNLTATQGTQVDNNKCTSTPIKDQLTEDVAESETLFSEVRQKVPCSTQTYCTLGWIQELPPNPTWKI